VTPPVTGFDLDMTLIDSRPAIMAGFAAVAAETGVPIDPAAVDRRLGIKPSEIEAAVLIYRARYRRVLGSLTTVLPGAAQALAAVRAAGGRAVVITAKQEAAARLSLESVGLAADEIFAEAHGAEKAAVLTALHAAVYVGDTPADILAAVSAGAHPVGVTTGSFGPAELRAAGAADVLESLTEFPSLYGKIIA